MGGDSDAGQPLDSVEWADSDTSPITFAALGKEVDSVVQPDTLPFSGRIEPGVMGLPGRSLPPTDARLFVMGGTATDNITLPGLMVPLPLS